MGYRADIDGLRAFAVFVVVFFHAGFDSMSGGFIGVDVFFVISGFLITKITANQIANNNFNLLAFYAKRIRRLYPALIFTVLLSLVLGYFIFMPDEMKELGLSAVSVVLYGSNVFFWLKSDYFDGPSELKPLLHTWSLSVEEQFYFIFPIVLVLIIRYFSKFKVLLLTILAVISFVASIYATYNISSAGFFLSPFRFWEFLLGGIVASYGIFDRCSFVAKNVFSFIGLAGLVFLSFYIDESDPFPGWLALFVCLSAVVFIGAYDSKAFAARIMSNPVLVFLGRISYSTYLIHWPLMVFYSYWIIREPSTTESLLMVLSSFALGYLMHRFIENAARDVNLNKRNTYLTYVYTAAISILIIVLGGTTYKTGGFKERFNTVAEAENKSAKKGFAENCFLGTEQHFSEWNKKECYFTKKEDTDGTVLIWGDSHADHLVPGIIENEANITTDILLYANAGCAPIFGTAPNGRPLCAENNDYVNTIIAQFNVEKVVLVANWQYAVEHGLDLSKLVESVGRLRELGVKVSIINQLPIYSFSNPDYLKSRLLKREVPDASFALKPSRGHEVNEKVEAYALSLKVPLYDPFSIFCSSGRCTVFEGGVMNVKDNSHLTRSGSEKLVKGLIGEYPGIFTLD
jgi:peptidoglycan/LPS O-acetylase OafA/YrhL